MANKINPTIQIGDKFGDLTVMEHVVGNSKGCWKCKCICGKDCYSCSNHLIYGIRKGCGCTATARRDTLKRGLWAEWEMCLLRLTYPIFDLSEIATYLNRPPRNVVYCLNRHNIQKTLKTEIKIGDIFGDLKVKTICVKVNKVGRLRKFAVCDCKCGNETNARFDSLLDGSCKSCGCGIGLLGNKSPKWKGYEEISGSKWLNIKASASRRSLDFKVSIQEIWRKFINQNRKCKLSGIDIHFAKTHRGKFKNETTACLDRIDSKEHYILENVQWLHKDINKMKQNLDQEYFLELCRKVAENNPRRLS